MSKMSLFQQMKNRIVLLRGDKRRKADAKKTFEAKSGLKIPDHLAVIMDGNGRWASARGLSRSAGHRAGGEALKELCKNCGDYGIRYVTVYAFSTENWQRPEEEVQALMDLFGEFFEQYDPEMEKQGVRVRFTGDLESLPESVWVVAKRAEEKSMHRDRLMLIVAMNYGGRREIAQACRAIAKRVERGDLAPDAITEATIKEHLYLPDVPDPDLLIRPSGEKRLSNFLLWESAYAEFWYANVLWPDFSRKDLEKALLDYTRRDRRYGGLSKDATNKGG